MWLGGAEIILQIYGRQANQFRAKVSGGVIIVYGIDLEYGNKTRSMSQK